MGEEARVEQGREKGCTSAEGCEHLCSWYGIVPFD